MVVVAAGCGGSHAPPPEPKIAKKDAASLVSLAQKVAHDAPIDGCAAQRDIAALNKRAHTLVASGRVPARLRAHLLVGVAAVAADAPACSPPAPAPAPAKAPEHSKGHEKHHGHGHKHGD